MEKVLVITGPTGVGKTSLSIFLAKELDGEIINADSMQVYKELNIGTAKIKEAEKEGIIHHLLDIKELDEEYSVFDFKKDASKKIEEIITRGKLPIIVGGTGFYIKALLYGYEFKEENKETYDYTNYSDQELYQKSIEINPNTNIHPNNRKRIERALTYNYLHNRNVEDNKNIEIKYDAFLIGLIDDRDKMYERINFRVDEMVKEGLLEEVKNLYDRNIKTKPVLGGIGYKELYEYFDNLTTKKEAIEKIKQNTRRYAKRQLTFFKHQLPLNWYKKEEGYQEKILEDIKKNRY